MAASHSNTLRFLTWNVNGLQTALDKKTKQLDVQDQINKAKDPTEVKDLENQLFRLKDLRKEMTKADVVFLQETHIKKGQTDVFRPFSDEWLILQTEYKEPERGVAVFINKKIKVTYINCNMDTDTSAFIVFHCLLNDQPYTLVNVYHHQNDEETLRHLSKCLQHHATGRLVIGGDFNTVFSRFLDKQEPTVNPNHSMLMKRLEPFMKSLQLVDVWRWLHPCKRFYTFYGGKSPSRLDYFFVPEELLRHVQACEIEDVSTNDHLPVSLHLNNDGIPLNCSQTPVELCKYNLSKQGDVRRSNEYGRIDIHALQISDTQRQTTILASVDERVTTEDIEMTIMSLQVSDTPRQDGIPANVYKENVKNGNLLQYLQVLYSRILDGSFDVNRNNFNATDPFNSHFFNADYIILASILARQLDEALKSVSGRHTRLDNEKHVAMMYSFFEAPQSVDRCLLEKALDSLSLSKDFMAFCTILKKIPGSQKYQLCPGCPLTPSLHSLLLTYVVRNDLGLHCQSDTEIHVHKYVVVAVVRKGSPLGEPRIIDIEEMRVKRSFGTSDAHRLRDTPTMRQSCPKPTLAHKVCKASLKARSQRK